MIILKVNNPIDFIHREESDKLINSLKSQCNMDINIIPISTKFTLNTICGTNIHCVLFYFKS